MSGPFIMAEHVSVAYGAVRAVRDVSFFISKGGVAGLIGPNGAGKTTLLRALNGSIPLAAGCVMIGDRKVTGMPRREISRIAAFVPQSLEVPTSLTVAEMVSMGRTPYIGGSGRMGHYDHEVVERVLDQTDLVRFADRLVHTLSAGEKQRAVVAIALAQEPELLLLDEPTAHLDIQHAWSLMELVSRLRSTANLTIVMCLHDLNLAAEFCEELILLERGEIVVHGPPDSVLRSDLLTRVYSHPVDALTLEGDRRIILPRRIAGGRA